MHFENPGASEEALEYDYVRRLTRLGLRKDLSLEKYPTLERRNDEEGYEVMRPRKTSTLPLLANSDADRQGVDDDRVYETLRLKKNVHPKIPKSNDLEDEEERIYETLRLPKKKSDQKNSKTSEDQNNEDGGESEGGYMVPSIKKEEFSLKKCPAYNVPTIERLKTGGGEKKDPNDSNSPEISKDDAEDEQVYEIPSIKKERFSLKKCPAYNVPILEQVRDGMDEKKLSLDTPDNGEADGSGEGGYEILLSAGHVSVPTIERAREEEGVELKGESSRTIPSSESSEEKKESFSFTVLPQAEDHGEGKEDVDGTYMCSQV